MKTLLSLLLPGFVSTSNAELSIQNLGAIWHIGDSITQSNADGDASSSPRKSLHNLLTAAGCTFTYTGHITRNIDGLPTTGDTPSTNLFHYHSGISGSCIGANPNGRTNMTANIPTWWNQGRLAIVRPNIILIMLGTNDMALNINVTDAPNRLKTFVDTVLAQVGPDDPAPIIFLAQIPPDTKQGMESQQVIDFNNALPAIVATLQSEGKDVTLVDHWTPLNADLRGLMISRVHPNAAGNDVIANQWFDAIEERFTTTPFACWQIEHWGNTTDPDAAWTAISDSDNLANIFQYYLGLDPLTADRPAPNSITTHDGKNFTRYQIPLNPNIDTSDLSLEYSFDANTWLPAMTTPDNTIRGSRSAESWSLEVSENDHPNVFFRLKATTEPN